MNNKKIQSIIIIVVLVVVIFVFAIVERVNYQKTIVTKNKIHLTTDYSNFFAVDEGVNKFVSYISNNKSNNVLNLLNKKFMEENNINESNVIEKIDICNVKNKLVSYKTKMMYEEKINDNFYKYYVMGELFEETNIDTVKLGKCYYIVNVNYDSFSGLGFLGST